ncbi:hypothetical protein GOV07_04595, partial [Candidatus Woesearchaeota archaeon]|nr:hypothetical protein [Candidatus Woesearchaeota archaeon]
GLAIPIVLSLGFLGGDIWHRLKKINLKYIEDQNPSMREMLRTAADNKDAESLMAHALFAEVIQKMKQVSSGTFLDFKEMGIKIGAMFALSMVLVSLAFFNVNIQKFENPLAGVGDSIGGFAGDMFGDGSIPEANLDQADEGIYGDPSIARLGDEELDITLQQSLTRIDFNTVDDADPSSDYPDSYPVDVSAQASEAYTAGLEDINDRKTAAEYSQQVK